MLVGSLFFISCGEEKPDKGKILFYQFRAEGSLKWTMAKARKEYRMISKAKGNKKEILTRITNTRPGTIVFESIYDEPLSSTELLFQITDKNTGSILYRRQVNIDPEMENSTTPINLITLMREIGKPLPSQIEFKEIVNNKVIARGTLTIDGNQ